MVAIVIETEVEPKPILCLPVNMLILPGPLLHWCASSAKEFGLGPEWFGLFLIDLLRSDDFVLDVIGRWFDIVTV